MNRFPFPWAGDRNIERGHCQPASTEPLPNSIPAAGFAAPAGGQISSQQQQRLGRTARQVLKSPHLKRRVSDRVYALWVAEQHQWNQRDRPRARFK